MYFFQNQIQDLTRKGSQTTYTMPRDYLAIWNYKPMEQQHLLHTQIKVFGVQFKSPRWSFVHFMTVIMMFR